MPKVTYDAGDVRTLITLHHDRYIKRITKTFYYTIFFSCHSLGVNTRFVKEALRLLRTNSSRSTFNRKRTEFHDTHKE